MIRMATELDLQELMQIENECFSRPYSNESFLQDLRGDKVKAFVKILNEKIVGFISLYIFLDEANLQQIAVLEDFRRKGISSELIEYSVEYLKQNKVKKIYLEVNETNFVAIKTYEKFGFKQVVTRKNYYGNQSAVVYELML